MRYEGIHILTVAGDDREMGYQHGVALRDAIRRGPLPQFARYVERFLAGTLGGLGAPLAKGLGFAMSETIGRSIAAKLPQNVREALDGLADGAQIPRAELMRAVTMPETYLWLASQWIARGKHPIAPRLAVPLYGCTSAIAWGGATAHGRMLHGRNFDYQGVGSWDREQAVIFHRPRDGQRYVAITAAGILFGGITAMNESGLSLVVHQHLHSTDFALGGLPVGIVGDRVMRHARTLDDAKRLLDDHIPNGSWTYVISSAREASVLCYEVTAKRRAVVPIEKDTFGYSNLFLARSMKDLEAHAYPSHWRNVVGRYHLATFRLGENHGAIDVEAIASILGDTGSPQCRFHDAIACLQTVASVVFDAGRGVVWVATGRAPVSLNPYVAFDLNEERARPDLGAVHPGESHTPSKRTAFDAYRDAYEAGFARGDHVEARRNIEVARRAHPEEPIYHFVAGLMSLREGDAVNAERAFERAIECGHPADQRVAGFKLWRARARDLRGARELAVDDYRSAADGDPNVKKAAEKGLQKPYKRGNIPLEWSFGDVVSP
jgi:tetratricopeptide (TPR) repeat protein